MSKRHIFPVEALSAGFGKTPHERNSNVLESYLMWFFFRDPLYTQYFYRHQITFQLTTAELLILEHRWAMEGKQILSFLFLKDSLYNFAS